MGLRDLFSTWRNRPAPKRQVGGPTGAGSPAGAGLGVRACDTCGTRWQSQYGMLKDAGMLTSGGFAVMSDPARKAGLTCTECSRSYCREHLGQAFPTEIPGGACPSCGSQLDLA